VSRKDAHRIKNEHGMDQLLLDLKPKIYEREVYLNQDVDVTKLSEYLEKRKEEGNHITYFHAIIAAIAKVIYNRKKLNRFIVNRHLYEHDKVIISFVAKVEFNDKAKEIMVLIPIEENDTIDTISEKINKEINKVRVDKTGDKDGGANGAIDILGVLPNVIRVPIMGFFKWLDRHGLLPKSLTSDLLYYSSMIITNVGSLGVNGIYHNITNFGTCPSMFAMGEVKDKVRVNNGKIETYKACNFGITFDEGCAEGFYLIKSIKLLEYLLNNPKLLEEKANTIYNNYYFKEKK